MSIHISMQYPLMTKEMLIKLKESGGEYIAGLRGSKEKGELYLNCNLKKKPSIKCKNMDGY